MKTTVQDFKNMVISMITHIPYIEDMPICPSVFSNDIQKHNCDSCPASKGNQGDTFDSNVCLTCWSDAMNNVQVDKL
jgi:hypothetical protein